VTPTANAARRAAGDRRAAKPVKLCVVCGRPREARYDPFCSRRCADVDLHRWLKGSYVIPGENARPEPDDE